ncbi:GPI-anchored small secreted protein [Suillus subluteus]|nr:GPI-anchored small secreted protein [Suillus subluteus]
MRSSAAILLASIASAFAYEVTSPGEGENWTTAGPNTLTWERVDTDPLNFTAVLTNEACVAMPQGPQVLNALVDGTLGSIVCNAPSGGWPTGSGYRVNFAANAENLDTLLAQSNQFNINSSSSSSTTTSTTTTGTGTGTTSSSSGATATTPTTAAGSSTTSDTSTTPSSTSFLTAVAAFAAFIATHF